MLPRAPPQEVPEPQRVEPRTTEADSGELGPVLMLIFAVALWWGAGGLFHAIKVIAFSNIVPGFDTWAVVESLVQTAASGVGSLLTASCDLTAHRGTVGSDVEE